MFAIDMYEPFVRAWNREGQHILSFGMRGQGPREMVRPRHILLHDDIISIVDSGLRRWTDFDRNGVAVASRRVESSVSRAGFSALHQALLYAQTNPACVEPRVWKVPRDESQAASVIATVEDAPTWEDDCPLTPRSFDVTPSGGFAVGYGYLEYMILMYESDGTLARKIEREGTEDGS